MNLECPYSWRQSSNYVVGWIRVTDPNVEVSSEWVLWNHIIKICRWVWRRSRRFTCYDGSRGCNGQQREGGHSQHYSAREQQFELHGSPPRFWGLLLRSIDLCPGGMKDIDFERGLRVAVKEVVGKYRVRTTGVRWPQCIPPQPSEIPKHCLARLAF
jgi:hypothetical protein